LRLGVFDSFSEPCDVRELVAELRVDADSLRVLLKALAADPPARSKCPHLAIQDVRCRHPRG
jgi:hypothetical protein